MKPAALAVVTACAVLLQGCLQVEQVPTCKVTAVPEGDGARHLQDEVKRFARERGYQFYILDGRYDPRWVYAGYNNRPELMLLEPPLRPDYVAYFYASRGHTEDQVKSDVKQLAGRLARLSETHVLAMGPDSPRPLAGSISACAPDLPS